MRIYNIFSKVKTWSFFLFLFVPFSLKSQKIQFIDCTNNTPLNDLFIFSENGKYIDFTNSNGFCDIGDSISQIKIIGLNIKDTLISVNGINIICLNRLSHNLQEFKVEEESIETKNLYLEMLQNSWEILQIKDTTCYYTFSYIITIPDSNWTERLNGVIKVEQSSKMRMPLVKYCKINHKADSNFLNSNIYNSNRLDGYVNIALNLTYYKKKNISKYVNKIDDIKLISSEQGMMFLTHSSDSKVEEKTYFKNGFIVKKEQRKINQNQILRLVNSYQSIEYTTTNKNKVADKFHLKKIKKIKEIFFIHELNISLIKEKYQDKDINFPVGILTYIKWLEQYNEYNKKSN